MMNLSNKRSESKTNVKIVSINVQVNCRMHQNIEVPDQHLYTRLEIESANATQKIL